LRESKNGQPIGVAEIVGGSNRLVILSTLAAKPRDPISAARASPVSDGRALRNLYGKDVPGRVRTIKDKHYRIINCCSSMRCSPSS
jgi:hypothetical protein